MGSGIPVWLRSDLQHQLKNVRRFVFTEDLKQFYLFIYFFFILIIQDFSVGIHYHETLNRI